MEAVIQDRDLRRRLGVVGGALALALLTWALVPVLSGRNALPFLGLLVALMLLVGLFDRPHLGVMAILVLWLVETSPQFLGTKYLTVPYVLTALLMVPLGVALLLDREIWILRSPHFRLLLGIGLVYFVSTGWAELSGQPEVAEIDSTFRKLQLLVARLAFLIFFVYFVTTRARVHGILAALVITTSLVAFDALTNAATGGTLRAEPRFIELNPNRLAYACLLATAFVYFHHSYHGRGRIVAFPLLFLLPATALASGSRSGFLQAVAFAAIAILGHPGRSTGQKLKGLGLVALAAPLVVAMVPDAALERASTFDPSVQGQGQESLQNRVDQVGSALGLIVEHPILGIGIGNFESVSMIEHRVYGGAHNAYLRAFAEGGILALGLYLALFYGALRELRRLERDGPVDLVWLAKSTRVGLILFLIAAATGDIFLEENLYLLLALTMTLSRMAAREGRQVAWVADPETPAEPAAGSRTVPSPA